MRNGCLYSGPSGAQLRLSTEPLAHTKMGVPQPRRACGHEGEVAILFPASQPQKELLSSGLAELGSQAPHPPLTVFWDGSCAPNPGRMGLGAVIVDATGRVLARRSRGAGRGDNNLAEYLAAMMAVDLANDYLGAKADSMPWQLCGDSLLIVKQVRGEWNADGDHHQLARFMREMLQGRPIIWVPRVENALADAAACDALSLEPGEDLEELEYFGRWAQSRRRPPKRIAA